ncbi:MAG: hypothetical protein ABSC08_02130 [Bryobacteraceae bacterium]|jgi:hypothetical protein
MRAPTKPAAPARGFRGYIDEHELAARLGFSLKCIQSWRTKRPNPGPPFLKTPAGRIRYSLELLEAWEKANTIGMEVA